jgi:hypothetical protein
MTERQPFRPASCFCQSDACKQSQQCLVKQIGLPSQLLHPYISAPGRQKFPLDLRCHASLTSQISPLSQPAPTYSTAEGSSSSGGAKADSCRRRSVSSQAVATDTQQPMRPSAIQPLSAMPWNKSSFGHTPCKIRYLLVAPYWIDVPMDKYKERPSPSFLNPSSLSLLFLQYTSRQNLTSNYLKHAFS